MKILKPGKLETRKFECKRCGCTFVANAKDPDGSNRLRCPTCEVNLFWTNGEFYEEPKRDIRDDREALYGLLLTAKPQSSSGELADYLIFNGVTFREE